MTDTTDNIILDGSSNFTLFGNVYSWDPNEPAFLVAYAGDTAGTATVNGTFTGDWFAFGMNIDSGSNRDLVLNFDDVNDGNIRFIGQVRLYEGTHSFDLTHTGVESFRGFRDADYDLNFGVFAQSVWLRSGTDNSTNITVNDGGGIIRTESGTNTLTVTGGFTGFARLGRYGEAGTNAVSTTNGIIKNLELNGTSHTVTVGSADIRNIKINDDGTSATIIANSTGEIDVLHSFVDTTLTASSYVRLIELGEGNSTLNLSGGAKLVSIGTGTSTLNISDGSIEALVGFGGNDTIEMTGGFISAAELAQGDNTVNVSGGGKIVSLTTGNGTDIITVTDGQIVNILSDDGDDIVTTGTQYTTSISVGEGHDTVTVASGGVGSIDTWRGDDTVTTGAGFVSSILVSGGSTYEGADADTVTVGTGGAGRVWTGAGDDTVTVTDSWVSNVTLGNGDDTVFINKSNGDGGVNVSGGGGADTVDFSGTQAAISITLNFSGRWQNIGNMDGVFNFDTIELGVFSISDSVENVTGTQFADIIKGSGPNAGLGVTGDNLLKGGLGADRIFGLAGDDEIHGEGGEDDLYGAAGQDTIFGGGADDRIFGGDENDVLDGGAGDDLIRGGSGNDTIFGDVGGDRLIGNDGNDTINGGGGGDLMFGGNGADTFVFDDIPNLGVDRVKDWQDGTDVLDLTAFGFGSFGEVVALASTFNVTDVRILFEPAKGIVLENFALADFDASDVIL